jgi:hypothetical protein
MTITEKIRRHMANNPRRATHDSRRIHVSERMSTRDQKIVADPAPRNPDIFGNTTAFSGRLAEIVAAVVATINTLPANERGAARSFAVCKIADAAAPADHPSAKLGHDPDASPSVPETDQREGGSLGAGPAGSRSTAAAMNDANRNYWDRAGNRYLSRDAAAIAAPGSIRAINLANSQFYGSQPKAPGRRWGER